MKSNHEGKDAATKNKTTTFFGAMIGAAAAVPN